MSKERGFGDVVRQAFARKQGDAAEPPSPRARSASVPENPRQAAPIPPADEPRPDPLTDGPWERRTFELERTLLEKNRSILRLEEEVARRDERLREAFARLRESEETVEIQHKLALLPLEEGAAVPRPSTPPDALARLASEKGELQTRERKLRGDVEALKQQIVAAERTLRARDAALAEAQAQRETREKELAEIRERLRASGSQKDEQRAAASERDRARSEVLRLEERLRAEAALRAKAEQGVVAAEQQAALYRKNLIRAEESHGSRGEELEAAVAARERAEGELRDVKVSAREGELSILRLQAEQRALVTAGERLRADGGRAREEAAAARRSAETLRAEIARLEARLAEAQESTLRSAADVRDREGALEGLRASLARSQAELDGERQSRRSERLEGEAAMRHLRDEAARLRAGLEAAEAAAKGAHAEVEVLEEALLGSWRLRARVELEVAEARAAAEAQAGEGGAFGASGAGDALLAAPAGAGRPVSAIRRFFRRG